MEVSSVYEGEVNGTPVNDESVEAVSPEFRGKEVIRCRLETQIDQWSTICMSVYRFV